MTTTRVVELYSPFMKARGRLIFKTEYVITRGATSASIFMSDSKFYVYSKEGCGFCDRLTEFMKTKGIGYEKLNLGRDFTPKDFLDRFGKQSTFPQVIQDNRHLGGMKDTVRFLMENKFV